MKYSVNKVEGYRAWEVLFGVFGKDGDEADYTMNWLFLSTSGIHGHYTTLDVIGKSLVKRSDEIDGDDIFYITWAVYKPRIVQVVYGGDLPVETWEQVAWLRKVVSRSLEGIKKSQRGNEEDAFLSR